MAKELHITLNKSVIGRTKVQKDTAIALGLKKINETVVKPDNIAVRGMIAKISHLITVEEK